MIRGVYPIPTLFTATSLIVSSVGIAMLFDGGEVAAHERGVEHGRTVA